MLGQSSFTFWFEGFMCFFFTLGTNRAREEGGSKGVPKNAMVGADGGLTGQWHGLQARPGVGTGPTCVFSPGFAAKDLAVCQPCLMLSEFQPRGRASTVLPLRSQGQG